MSTSLAAGYPEPTRGRIVVMGLLGSTPFGGMTWQVLHYIAGFRRLGFDVWYAEEFEHYALDPSTAGHSADVRRNLDYVTSWMDRIGLGDRWIYRPAGTDEFFGGDESRLLELYRTADAVIDVCGVHALGMTRPDVANLVYVETDPVSQQVWVADGNEWIIQVLAGYHRHFTYGVNLGTPVSPVPIERFSWKPTRPPVIIDWWDSAVQPREALTTVTSWRQKGKDAVLGGRELRWSKREQWMAFIDVARRSPLPIELAVLDLEPNDEKLLSDSGWMVTDAADLFDPETYRDYIRRSFGELSVAKEQYVIPVTGWFSDRSVCYLAAGRPVITQDTGFGHDVATGEGLLPFSTPAEAVEAIEEVAADYERHAKAAREVASEYFAAEKVLEKMAQEW